MSDSINIKVVYLLPSNNITTPGKKESINRIIKLYFFNGKKFFIIFRFLFENK